MEPLQLELFVTADDQDSERALAQARELGRDLADRARLEVIDVAMHPERAARAQVLVTPCLIRCKPAPERRVVGDLGDRRAVLGALRIDGVEAP